MPSWNDGEMSSDDDCQAVSMDMGLLVDGPWPPVLQRCLDKLWEMFHEENCGRVLDKEKFEKELAKLKTENDKLSMECCKLVEDVSKMFGWQDGKVDGKMNQKQMDDVAV
ncbi:hypothetical protein D1007_21603 [Hordeum vulgare]|nr:hypothetical protein D1007_21603 [Hordeum vulgare]